MGEEYMKSVPMPTEENDVVQVVIQIRHLKILQRVASAVHHQVVGPFQVGDEDVPTFFFHPVIEGDTGE